MITKKPKKYTQKNCTRMYVLRKISRDLERAADRHGIGTSEFLNSMLARGLKALKRKL